jgi:outer membrane protein
MNDTRRKVLVHTAGLLAVFALLVLVAAPVQAEKGDWIIRARGIVVDPDDSSGVVSSDGVPIDGSGVTVDDDTVPEVDFTYFLTHRLALELIVATSDHNISATGTLGSLGQIASTSVLPPSLLLQYHFMPDMAIRPYVGAGINYTYFFDEEATASFDEAAGGVSNVDLGSSFGLAAQVGIDFGIGTNWLINADIKYLDISTDATIDTGALGRVTVDVDITPWVYGIGVGYRF